MSESKVKVSKVPKSYFLVVVSSHQKLAAERGSCRSSCEEMSEAAESAGSVEDGASANEVLLEEFSGRNVS